MNKLTINQWAKEDRPREKLAEKGPKSLSNAELLAILIGSGSREESAVCLMKRILNDCNQSLNTLGKKSIEELTAYNGIGEAKAITIIAACELGKRRAMQKAEERKKLDSPMAIYEHLHPRMQDLDVEEAWIVLLNQDYKLINTIQISRGGISETAIDVRIILKEAILNNATIMAMAHNHPSNNIKPSRNDDALTKKVQKACELMRIYFLDHIIVTDGNYYSYREENRI